MSSIPKPTPFYEIEDIRTKDVTVNAASALELKAGHLLFMDIQTGKYTAVAATTSLIPTEESGGGEGGDVVADAYNGPVAVLLEDTSIKASNDTTVKVIIAGTVYYSFVRNSGINETACPDWLLDKFSALQTQVLFLGKEE